MKKIVHLMLVASISACGQIAVVTATARSKDTDTRVLAAGRRWTNAFYERQLDAMWQKFDTKMQLALGNKATFNSFRESVDAQLGAETAIISETIARDGELAVYERTATFARAPIAIRVAFAFTPDGHIAAFTVRPSTKAAAAPTTKLDYQTRTSLQLPFGDTWKTVWGGRTIEQNHHVAVPQQRFAYDFVVEKNGTTHQADGKHNADYFAYGRPVNAPGAGTVVVVVDGIAENVPGQMNASQPAGNYVILDHGDGEYSLLAHFVPSSIAVKVGERVRAGQLVARCGNSGNSSEPHLHYHLQDAPKADEGEGLPAQFENYRANGQAIARGEPVRGDMISTDGRE